MVGAVGEDGAHVDNRIAGQNPRFQGLLDAGVDGRDVLPGNDAAGDLVDELAARLAGPDMDSGFGLRTLTARSPRFSRLSYHGGTVWPHDTAIAAHGLMREGHPETAAALLRGLLEAAPTFGYRLPELYGGDSACDAAAPTPYPSACRPQAWSATAVLHALTTLLGIEPDVPTGRVRVRGDATPFGPMSVSGLRLGSRALEVSVDAGGVVSAGCDDPSVDVLCR